MPDDDRDDAQAWESEYEAWCAEQEEREAAATEAAKEGV